MPGVIARFGLFSLALIDVLAPFRGRLFHCLQGVRERVRTDRSIDRPTDRST